jgi:integrase
MASITQDRKAWRVLIRRAGRKPVSRSFKTHQEAVKWARATETAADSGKSIERGKATVEDMIAEYRQAREEAGHPVAKKSNEDYMLAHLSVYFAGRRIAALDTAALVEFCRTRRRAGAGPYTVNMEVSKLGTALRYACSLLNVAWNDPIATARPTLHHLKLIGPGGKRTRRPSAEEWAALLMYEWRARIPMRDVLELAALVALRRGEIFRLCWADLDQERRVILVRDRKHPRRKVGNNEELPLVGHALDIIMRQPRSETEPRIFPHEPGTASKAFKAACDDLGIVNLHFHDMRHEAASALFDAGWDIAAVAAVTGHHDWRHLRRYTQMNPAKIALRSIGQRPDNPPRPQSETAASPPGTERGVIPSFPWLCQARTVFTSRPRAADSCSRPSTGPKRSNISTLVSMLTCCPPLLGRRRGMALPCAVSSAELRDRSGLSGASWTCQTTHIRAGSRRLRIRR